MYIPISSKLDRIKIASKGTYRDIIPSIQVRIYRAIFSFKAKSTHFFLSLISIYKTYNIKKNKCTILNYIFIHPKKKKKGSDQLRICGKLQRRRLKRCKRLGVQKRHPRRDLPAIPSEEHAVL